MQAASDLFLAALRFSHSVVGVATIFPPDGSGPFALALISGDVTTDRSSQVRRTAQLVVPWTFDSPPASSFDPRDLAFGGYVQLERGLRYGDGTTELLPAGFLRIDSVSWRTSEHAAQLSCSDRMAQVRDEPLLAPYTPTMTQSQAAVELVYAVFGDAIEYHVTPGSNENVLVDTTYSDSPADAITDLASSCSCEAFFDETGDFVYRPTSSVDTDPVWTIDAGATGVLVDADEALSRDGVYNGVLAGGIADAATPPFWALVVDNDADSPTRWGGPFGKVALVTTSTAIQTQAQAQATATDLLNVNLGLSRTLDLSSVPNPALQLSDVLTVAMPNGTSETQTIDAIQLPLGPSGPQIVTARSLFNPGDYTPPTRRVFTDARAWQELVA